MNKQKMKNLFLCAAFALALSSCGKKAVINKQLGDSFKVQEAKFDYLTSRAKILYKDDNQEVSAAVDIRMKKDSIIWMSIKPMLGIEVMRIIITKDSVLILDRMNKSMNLMSMSGLSQKIGFSLSFKMAESLIIGNLPLDVKGKGKVMIEKEHFRLQQEEGDFDLVSLISREHYKLERVNVKQRDTKNELLIRYEDFKVIGQQLIPFTSTAVLSYKSKGTGKGSPEIELNMNHGKIDLPLTPLSFPFQRLQIEK
jgi:hypothetical protein